MSDINSSLSAYQATRSDRAAFAYIIRCSGDGSGSGSSICPLRINEDEIVPAGHARAVIVPISCDELDAVLAMRSRLHRAIEVGKDSIVTLQSTGFELRSSLHK